MAGPLWRFLARGEEPTICRASCSSAPSGLSLSSCALASPSADQCPASGTGMELHEHSGTGGRYPPASICASGRDSALASSARESSSSPTAWPDLTVIFFLWFSIRLNFWLNCKELGLSLPGLGSALHCRVSLLSNDEAGKQKRSPQKTTSLWPKATAPEPPWLRNTLIPWGGSLPNLGLSPALQLGDSFPKNTCCLINPGSAYLKGHIRQLAYLL